MNGPCVDVYGRQINEGDWVLYTTNAEGGGFQFGHVDKIKSKHGTYRNGTPWVRYYIVVSKTDENKQPKMDTAYDTILRKTITTNKQLRSGQIEHRTDKFMIMP